MSKLISGEDLMAMCEQAEKVLNSKGNRFYISSYLKGLRDAEKFHGITIPTHTTRESRSKVKEVSNGTND